MLLIVLMLGSTANNSNSPLLPGLTVITSPLLGRNNIWEMRATFNYLTFAYGAALFSQFFLAMIAFIACTRRYRAPDAIGLNDSLGTFLLLTWVGISGIGIGFFDEFERASWYHEIDYSAQFVATVLSAMLLAIIPLSSSARSILAWKRNGGPSATAPKLPMPMIIVMFAATAIISSLLAVHPGHFFTADLNGSAKIVVCETILIIAAYIVTMGLMLRWIHAVFSKPWILVIAWLLLTWIVPLLADMIYHSMHPAMDESLGQISSLSPIGALAMIWSEKSTPVNAGLIFQMMLIALPALLLRKQDDDRNRKCRR